MATLLAPRHAVSVLLPVLVGSACATSPPPAPTTAAAKLPFIEDDYPRALAEARAKNRPLFVDAWAPWCHTCRFMRAYVLADPALGAHAARFVWLSIDTEKAESAAFLERYPIEVWPTLLVIDPAAERAVLRWPGSATVPQLTRLLDDGERALASRDDGPIERESPPIQLARADRLAGDRRTAEAATAYRAALAAAPADRRPRVVESLVLSLLAAHDYAACAQTAQVEAPALLRGPSFANIVASGLYCASAAPKEAPFRAAALAALELLGAEALGLPGLLADDRSGLYEVLTDVRADAGDAPAAKALALRWLGFLEAEAAHAANVEERAAFDPHRVAAAIAAKEPLRAVAALQQTERDLPTDYNPPARLALLYREAGRLDDALAAIDRALARVYGPRTIRLLETKAGIQSARGEPAAARKTLEAALKTAEALPAAQRRDEIVARLRAALARKK